MIHARDLPALPVEAASYIGGGSRLLVAATRTLALRFIGVALVPRVTARPSCSASVTIYSTGKES